MSSNIDWPRLLGDIAYLLGEQLPGTVAREPVGTPTLARHLNKSRGAVRNWLEGTEPRHSEGQELIEVWCSLSGKAAGYAPICVRSMSAAKSRA